jgi:UDP:flavonoid glycosyltransferase YjiC (YdhE family)
MVALPIGYDQPGVAARIEYHGVGESLEVETLTGKQMLEAIRTVLENPSYRERALYFKDVIAKGHGLDVAADVIEQAFRKVTTEELDGEYSAISQA